MTGLAKIMEAAQPAGAGGDVVQDALVAIREHLGMEVAYLSEFVDGRAVFRRVDAPGLEHLIKPGDSQSLDDIYCNHIIEGRLPQLIPDTAQEPLCRTLPITDAVPIGSHASIPVRLPGGEVYGMFCCLSPRPNPSLNARDLATMKIFAELATRQIHLDLARDSAAAAKRAAVEAIIVGNGFDIAFQPIFGLVGMRILAYEALSRFRSEPYRTPDKWFRDAADVGLGVELELGAIRAAVAAFADARLDRTILELTEHAPVVDYAVLHQALAPLRQRGLRIAIDDAGAGYAGLQHIVQMAPDVIKMDMSLTRGIDQDRARRALASAMIFYARETGAEVVAEGVETEAELMTLKMLGVARGQGYLLGRPGPLGATHPGSQARLG